MSTNRDNRVSRPRTGHDRRHLFPGRPRAVHARFTDDEYAELAAAAELAALTPTGFCAQAALDAARNLHSNTAERVEHQTLGSLQAELLRARLTLNQFRVELSSHPSPHHPVPVNLDEIMAGAAETLRRLDTLVSRVHASLPGAKPP